MLQSTARGPALGRFDILLAFPGEQLVAASTSRYSDFLGSMDSRWNRERESEATSALPFRGGWFLYLGYELAGEIEPTLNLKADPVLPRAFAVRCPAAIIRDHQEQKTIAVCEGGYAGLIDALQADVLAARSFGQPANDESAELRRVAEDEAGRFLSAVELAKQHIAAGDVFQANLSRSWSVTTQLSARDIYTRLVAANPAPFAGSVTWNDSWILSSSPERLLQIRNGIASTRPIAGTRPRASIREQDKGLSDELFAHPKERAEHVMLVDLERNDLGRVCEPGTVEVNEMMVLESYAHVHHIVSNVRGRLRNDVTPGSAIRAIFPGGTITGCPKVRCMQIIAELEDAPRGAYTGSFGYLNRDGSLDLNILIRTMVKHGTTVQLRAGAGIVADSEPRAELAETRAKARGLLEALR